MTVTGVRSFLLFYFLCLGCVCRLADSKLLALFLDTHTHTHTNICGVSGVLLLAPQSSVDMCVFFAVHDMCFC